MSAHWPVVTLGVSLVILAALVARRAFIWRQGTAAKVDPLRGLRALPRRYLVDVHRAVSDKPLVAWMHVAAAGGLVASLACLGLLALFGSSPVLAWLVLAAQALALLGAAMIVVRRLRDSAHLSQGLYRWLPVGLAGFALFNAYAVWPDATGQTVPGATSLLGALVFGWGVVGYLIMVAGLGIGPMKHALNGALNLIFHPRPGRFQDAYGETALQTMDLDRTDLGAKHIDDFAWNRRLMFDACVECGRCEAACPAFAAGQPLNPKALIQDLAAAQDLPALVGYAGARHPDMSATDPVADSGDALSRLEALVASSTLWSCTTCRACVAACPMMIEHVDAIVDLRRAQTMEYGHTPGKAAEVLDNLRHAGNALGAPAQAAADALMDLDIPLLRERRSCRTLLWLGGGAFEPRTQRTIRALAELCQLAGDDIAILGDEETDTGDTARRLGDEATFVQLARTVIATLDQYRFEQIVTPDPHAYHCLKNEYPDFGGHYKVLHHSDYLADCVAHGLLPIEPMAGQRLTYHDPCYLARYNGQTAAPRALLSALSGGIVEMKQSGLNSFCCGGGGGAPLTDIPGERRIADIRMEQARETEADILAVACPGCTGMLEGVVGEGPVVRDIAELLLEGVRQP